jgi:hypothetical protein
MELDSRHTAGPENLEVVLRVLKSYWTSGLNLKGNDEKSVGC